MLNPKEILEQQIEIGIIKANRSLFSTFLLSILGGAFIALAGIGANVASVDFIMNGYFSVGKYISGSVFPIGLILVVLCGAELFTGNILISISYLNKKITLVKMIKNLITVYIGNLIGSILIAFFIANSGQLNSINGLLGVLTLKIAIGKIKLTFIKAIILGILCNWLVCLAIWMSIGAKNMIGKTFAIFFPIMLFIISGYEHSIANMYYISIGIITKNNPNYFFVNGEKIITEPMLSSLNWSNMFINNLIPVTIGNIIGGFIFVALIYNVALKEK